MTFTRAMKLKNRLYLPLYSKVEHQLAFGSLKFSIRGVFRSNPMAHIPLETQANGSGRSVLGYYVGFSEHRRGGILVFDPKLHHYTTHVQSSRVSGGTTP